MRRAVGILLIVSLFGCASSTGALLIGKTSGELGTGTFNPGGDITIRLKNKTYTGTWMLMPQGLGTALATAADGTTVLCNYTYDNRSKGGNGVCRETGTGEVFDMQIR